MKKTPVSVVKEKYGDKEKLVAAVQKLATEELWLDRVNETKGLARVSNAKLLRLIDTLGSVKERFGTRAKLIDAILVLEKRTKDAGYQARLEGYPTPRLLDHHDAAAKRAKRAEAAAKAAPAKPAKKKAAKKPAAQKSA
jgi:hypothetical protein